MENLINSDFIWFVLENFMNFMKQDGNQQVNRPQTSLNWLNIIIYSNISRLVDSIKYLNNVNLLKTWFLSSISMSNFQLGLFC